MLLFLFFLNLLLIFIRLLLLEMIFLFLLFSTESSRLSRIFFLFIIFLLTTFYLTLIFLFFVFNALLCLKCYHLVYWSTMSLKILVYKLAVSLFFFYSWSLWRLSKVFVHLLMNVLKVCSSLSLLFILYFPIKIIKLKRFNHWWIFRIENSEVFTF